jgi:hypothetical protein
MPSFFDSCLVEVTLQVAGQPLILSGLNIISSGTKYANDISAECECRIYNLTREQQNNILTTASPLYKCECRIYNLTREQQNNILTTASPLYKAGQPRTPINMTLCIGRESYGTFVLWKGYVFHSGMTQPPDIGIVLRVLTNNLLTGLIAGVNQPQTALLSVIARGVAQANGLTLAFQATDKQVNNFVVNGSAQQQLHALGQIGGIDVINDNGELVIIDSVKARAGDNIVIDAANGMVGIPTATDTGVLVRVMATNAIKVGCGVTIDSQLNPAANGTYKVIQLGFEVASRDQPFWYNLYCSNLPLYQGTSG